MNVYMKAPYSEIFTDRESAANTIQGLFCESRAALAAFDVRCDLLEEDGYTPDEIEALKADEATVYEWMTYRAYDLIMDAETCGHAALYGVEIYMDAEAEALEERAADLFDPWACDEARAAAFFDIYTAGDGLLAMVEALRELLAEAPELAAEVEQLSSDLLSYYEQRQQKEVVA